MPECQVIVITSGKGGVGKTTTTANLGAGLSMAGKRVLLIDADTGLRNLDLVVGLENRIVFDIYDVVTGACRPKQALIRDKRFPTLWLLPASQTRDKDSISQEDMKKICEDLSCDFDYILIDCPAGIEQGFKNAIVAANVAIVVTTPEVSAVRDADRIVGILESGGMKGIFLIINRIRTDMIKKGNMMTVEDILEILAIKLIGIIPDDQTIIISTNKGEPIVSDSKAIPAQAYKNVVRRILNEKVPFLDLEQYTGFMSIIKRIFGKRKTE